MEYELPCEPSDDQDAMVCNVTARDCIRQIRQLPDESQIMCLVMALGMYLRDRPEPDRFAVFAAMLGTLPIVMRNLKPISVH